MFDTSRSRRSRASRSSRWTVPFGALLLVMLLTVACAPAAPAAPTTSPPAAAVAAAPSAAPSAAASAVPSAAPSAAAAGNAAPATAADDGFYKGKTVRLIVGFSPGGGFDTQARLLAKHLPKHLVGNPTIVVENMPGAGSLQAANHLFKIAQPDGLTLGTFIEQLVVSQLLGTNGIDFDARAFTWLGSPETNLVACVARADSGYKTFRDLLNAPKPLVVGATASSDTTYQFPVALKEVTGANFKVVSGYSGSNKITLAMESNEVDGTCVTWSSLKSAHPEWFADKTYVVLAQNGLQKHPDLQDVPLSTEFATSDLDRQLLRTLIAPTAMAKPIVAPPNMPAERVATLRAAIAATYKDPEFVADAARADLDLSPKTGAEVESTVREIFEAQPETVQRLRTILGGQG
jgi:tripartite-type tricarboxylate transporter receptor subunit TctC